MQKEEDTASQVLQHGHHHTTTISGILRHCREIRSRIPLSEGWMQFFIVILFFVVCILYYHHVEDWDVLDCIYFITVTITTIGYGDVTPTTDGSKIFTIFVIFIGVFIITNWVATAMTLLVQRGMNILIDKIYYGYKSSGSRESLGERRPSHWVSKIAIVFSLIVIVITVGVVFLMGNGDQTLVDSLYWSVVSITSVGYGDISLDSNDERVFVILFIFSALFTVSAGVAIILEIIAEENFRQEEIRLMGLELDIKRLTELDKTGEGVDKSTFVLAILKQLGVVDENKHIIPWERKFDEYDKDGSGRLDEEDLRLMNDKENTIRRNSFIDLTEDTAKRFVEEGVTKLFHADHPVASEHGHLRESMDVRHSKNLVGTISGDVHLIKDTYNDNKVNNADFSPMH